MRSISSRYQAGVATLIVLLITVANLKVVEPQWIDEDDRKVESDLVKRQYPGEGKPLGRSGISVVNTKTGDRISLLPGLLDETLLSKGSFQFDTNLVKFDKLRVSGNVYVNRINGKLLREAYLIRPPPAGGAIMLPKSKLEPISNHQHRQPQPQQHPHQAEMTLRVL